MLEVLAGARSTEDEQALLAADRDAQTRTVRVEVDPLLAVATADRLARFGRQRPKPNEPIAKRLRRTLRQPLCDLARLGPVRDPH